MATDGNFWKSVELAWKGRLGMVWHMAETALPKVHAESVFKNMIFLTLLMNSGNNENNFLLLDLIIHTEVYISNNQIN